MIVAIDGTLVTKQPHRTVVRWQGLEIEFSTPFSTYGTLGEAGSPVHLLSHLVWREDGPQLFGFATEEERSLFRLLTKVDKIGPKLAITILSSAPPRKLAELILTENQRALTALKGVGPKLASRMIVELKDGLVQLGLGAVDGVPITGKAAEAVVPHAAEAREALENLGYTGREIDRALEAIAPTLTPADDLEKVLAMALQQFAR